MREELELQLVKKYPELFKHYKGDPKVTCMAWGCAHGDGWYEILENLCEDLSDYEGLVFAQIKEKFGRLTVYVNGTTDENWQEVHDLINDATLDSAETCEDCGAPGRARDGAWRLTLCDECEEERNARKMSKR
jgi:hypothetical protein